MMPTSSRSLSLAAALSILVAVAAFLVPAPAHAGTMLVQPSGKIVLGGYGFPNFGALVRYKADGSLDTSFGKGGIAYDRRLQPFGDLVEQPDGKILAAASRLRNPAPEPQLGRYLADGTADRSFGSNGLTFSPFENSGSAQPAGLLVRKDGSIVAGFNHCCERFNGASGSVEQFSVGGDWTGKLGQLGSAWPGEAATLSDLLELPGGALIGVGHAIRREGGSTFQEGLALVRFLPGSTGPDPTFGNGEGIVLGPGGAIATAVTGEDGKLLLAGVNGEIGLLARYEDSGVPDTSFGTEGGYVTFRVPNSGGYRLKAVAVALAPDGSIFAVGTTINSFDSTDSSQPCKADCSHPFLAKFTPTGQLDPSFGAGGILTLEGEAVPSMAGADTAVLPDGKILVSGETGSEESPSNAPRGFALLRLSPDGQLDPSFGKGGVATTVTCPGTEKQRRARGCLPSAKVSLQVRGARGPRPYLALRVRPKGSWRGILSVRLILPHALTVSAARIERGAGFSASAKGHGITTIVRPHSLELVPRSLEFDGSPQYTRSISATLWHHALKASKPFPRGRLRFRVLVRFGERTRWSEGEQTVVLMRRG
jgi:uncharacterized delta-60 repeat protein